MTVPTHRKTSAPPGAPTFSVGPDGRIRALNRAAEAMFGISANAGQGATFADYLELFGAETLPIAALAAHSFWTSYSGRIRRGPHAGQTVQFRARGLADSSGRLTHVLLVGETGAEPGLPRSRDRLPDTQRHPVTAAPVPVLSAAGSDRTLLLDSVLRGASGSGLRHRVERLCAVEEVLYETAAEAGGLTFQALLGTLVRRFRQRGGLSGDRIEFCADETSIPLFAAPSVTLVLHETLWVLLSEPDRTAGRDTIRVVVWSDKSGSWRLIARSIGDRLQREVAPTGELAALIGHLGGEPLPEGFSGAGFALTFPPFGTRPIH